MRPSQSKPFLLCALLVVLAIAGCRARPTLVPDRPQTAAGVKLEDVNFHSAALQHNVLYRVFLPASVPSGQKLPVVYLLHGNGGSSRDWSNDSDVSRYAAQNLILVMPEGGSSYYMNAALKPEDLYEDFLTRDLIADVESRFPAAKNRASRAIVGVSMGGFAAVKLALTRPDLYVFAGGISPAVDVPSRRFTLRRWSQSTRFRVIFGRDCSQTRTGSDPFLLVQSANPAATPYLYVTAGEEEALLEPIRRFAGRLLEHRFAYEFHTRSGGHDWVEWDAQIPGCFASLLAHIERSRSSY